MQAARSWLPDLDNDVLFPIFINSPVWGLALGSLIFLEMILSGGGRSKVAGPHNRTALIRRGMKEHSAAFCSFTKGAGWRVF